MLHKNRMTEGATHTLDEAPLFEAILECSQCQELLYSHETGVCFEPILESESVGRASQPQPPPVRRIRQPLRPFDFRIQNAMKYGPTPSEVFGDIGRGLSSMAKGYGIPFVSSIMRGVDAVKSGVEAAWDAVRGESTSAQGTAFPQPGSDTKDLFSSIDTGIAEVDPNNMLANIARQNQYEDIPFDQLLSNATAQNLNIPKTIQEVVTDVGLSPVVTVDTPLGKVNVNRLTGDLVTGGNVGNLNYVLQGNPLSEGYGANLNCYYWDLMRLK